MPNLILAHITAITFQEHPCLLHLTTQAGDPVTQSVSRRDIRRIEFLIRRDFPNGVLPEPIPVTIRQVDNRSTPDHPVWSVVDVRRQQSAKGRELRAYDVLQQDGMTWAIRRVCPPIENIQPVLVAPYTGAWMPRRGETIRELALAADSTYIVERALCSLSAPRLERN